MMNFNDTLGVHVKHLSKLYVRHFYKVKDSIQGMENMTAMQGWVVRFIAEHSEKDVFQKDIEAELDIRSSSATALLKRMEKNGLITRVPVPNDTRWKKITLTPKAQEFKLKATAEMTALEQKALQGLTASEKETLFLLLQKVTKNLS